MYDHWRPDVGVRRTAPPELPADRDSLALAAGFLALGSFILFAGLGLVLTLVRGYGALFLVCFPIFTAVVIHAAAWWQLGVYAVRHGAARPAVFAAFVASLALFGLSMGGLFWGTLPLRFLENLALFPVLPWVWAPVVLSHAVLFGAASRDLDPRAQTWARAGTYILVGLAVVALLGQVGIVDFGIGLFVLAGWTFVGYLILASCFSWGARPQPAPAPYPPLRGFAA
jgi:hypothetical protein